MTINDDHNHFCIYCGAKLEFGQHFCTQCGREVFRVEQPVEAIPSKYDDMLFDIEQEYDIKQKRAKELVGKLFDPTHMTYTKFLSSINNSNKLFISQMEVTKKMIEVNEGSKEFVEREIDNKLKILRTFIDKMNDLIDELVIHLSSNKDDSTEINNLFKDMDDLIDSVKDY